MKIFYGSHNKHTQTYIPTYGHDHGVFLGITVETLILQSLQYGSASIKSLHALQEKCLYQPLGKFTFQNMSFDVLIQPRLKKHCDSEMKLSGCTWNNY